MGNIDIYMYECMCWVVFNIIIIFRVFNVLPNLVLLDDLPRGKEIEEIDSDKPQKVCCITWQKRDEKVEKLKQFYVNYDRGTHTKPAS